MLLNSRNGPPVAQMCPSINTGGHHPASAILFGQGAVAAQPEVVEQLSALKTESHYGVEPDWQAPFAPHQEACDQQQCDDSGGDRRHPRLRNRVARHVATPTGRTIVTSRIGRCSSAASTPRRIEAAQIGM